MGRVSRYDNYIATQWLTSSSLVMSDWGGTNSVADSLNAGLALEMPGPAKHFTNEAVRAAISGGKLKEETINERIKELLQLFVKTGKFKHPETPAEQVVINPAHTKLIREAGAQGIVLLKNEDSILPLQKDKIKNLAVLGLAKETLAHGGGSAAVNGHHSVTPYDALKRSFGRSELLYAQGVRLLRILPPISSNIVDLAGEPGFTLTKYSPIDLHKMSEENIATSYFMTLQEPFGAVTLEGTYSPPISGNYYLELSSIGPAKFFVDDREVYDIPHDGASPMEFSGGGAPGEKFRFEFKQGKKYKVKIEAAAPLKGDFGFLLLDGILGVAFGLLSQQEYEEDLIGAAVTAAKSAETALVFVGHTVPWETEGRDQHSLNLPVDGSQDRLIDAVADANPNTVVINSTGVAIAMPWLHKVKAVVQTWFPGQEAGDSIVDVLTGSVNPGGRLPITIPRRIEDTPAFGNFPGNLKKHEVDYAEGSFIGYRHYEHYPETILFPFGFGLSYTTYDTSDAKLTWGKSEMPAPASSIFVASTSVRNTGNTTGNEVIQVYVTPVEAPPGQRTQRKLVGFAKVTLKPKEAKRAEVKFAADSFAEFDEGTRQWLVAEGDYRVDIATSAAKADVKAYFSFHIKQDYFFAP